MSILPDHEIRRLSKEEGMIKPFVEKLQDKGKISYGLSSYGYDARVGDEFKVFTNVNTSIVDPKDFTEDSFVTRRGDIIIPPNSFVLCHTVEYFKIPKDVLVICLGKSTYARCGLVVNVTPLEPGWEGQVTIEISNTTPLPAKVYANEGICQFLFFRGESACETPYNARGGKYMGQQGVTIPRILNGYQGGSTEVTSGIKDKSVSTVFPLTDLRGQFIRPNYEKYDIIEPSLPKGPRVDTPWSVSIDDLFRGKGREPYPHETLEDLRAREDKGDPALPPGYLRCEGQYLVRFDGKDRWVFPTEAERKAEAERLAKEGVDTFDVPPHFRKHYAMNRWMKRKGVCTIMREAAQIEFRTSNCFLYDRKLFKSKQLLIDQLERGSITPEYFFETYKKFATSKTYKK